MENTGPFCPSRHQDKKNANLLQLGLCLWCVAHRRLETLLLCELYVFILVFIILTMIQFYDFFFAENWFLKVSSGVQHTGPFCPSHRRNKKKCKSSLSWITPLKFLTVPLRDDNAAKSPSRRQGLRTIGTLPYFYVPNSRGSLRVGSRCY